MLYLPCLIGRKNAAGYKKLAAFFLLFVFTFTLYAEKLPFVVSGVLYFLNENKEVTVYEGAAGFSQRVVCKSKKDDYILAWKQNSQKLLNINENGKIVAETPLEAAAVFLNENYVLTQSNSYDENKGFGFTLFKINYSRFTENIKLKPVWKGSIDCFISDCVFIKDGICIGGGTRDNLRHNVYRISEKGIHKCFTMNKNSDFIRILKSPASEDLMFAFVSSRDKSKAPAVIYSFTLEGNSSSVNNQKMDLREKRMFPENYDSFFGYGFVYEDSLIIPASVDGMVEFINYNPAKNEIVNIVPDSLGCNFPLGSFDNQKSFFYIARDPLIPESFFGIAEYNGKECRIVEEFR